MTHKVVGGSFVAPSKPPQKRGLEVGLEERSMCRPEIFWLLYILYELESPLPAGGTAVYVHRNALDAVGWIHWILRVQKSTEKTLISRNYKHIELSQANMDD